MDDDIDGVQIGEGTKGPQDGGPIQLQASILRE